MKQLAQLSNVYIVCSGSDCKKQGAAKVRGAIREAVRGAGKRRSSLIVQSKCMGLCKSAPVAYSQAGDEWLPCATPKKARALVASG